MEHSYRSMGRFIIFEQDGFTLIELMVTVIISGIMLAIALPAMDRLSKNAGLDARAHELADILNYGRAEARRTGQPVLFCPLVDTNDKCISVLGTLSSSSKVFAAVVVNSGGATAGDVSWPYQLTGATPGSLNFNEGKYHVIKKLAICAEFGQALPASCRYTYRPFLYRRIVGKWGIEDEQSFFGITPDGTVIGSNNGRVGKIYIINICVAGDDDMCGNQTTPKIFRRVVVQPNGRAFVCKPNSTHKLCSMETINAA